VEKVDYKNVDQFREMERHWLSGGSVGRPTSGFFFEIRFHAEENVLEKIKELLSAVNSIAADEWLHEERARLKLPAWC
jgi:hypothetical protein